MRFGQDNRVAVLSYRSWAHWFLGYPRAAIADSDQALREARQIGQAATMMYALTHASLIHIFCGNYTTAQANADELLAMANDKNTAFWKSQAVSLCGQISSLTGKPEIAIEMISAGVAAYRLTGSTVWVSLCLTSLARAYADVGRLDDAWRSISELINAIKGSMERWWEAEAHRVAGEIALKSADPTRRGRKHISKARSRRHGPSRRILGAARRDEPRTPLARPGQGAASARTAGSGLRVVHRGVRHARSEGGEGAARGTGVIEDDP